MAAQASFADKPVVGVVGAGTMGAGIAQLALEAGCRVHLYDVMDSMLEKARTAMLGRWQRHVEQGRLQADELEQRSAALSCTTDLNQLSTVDIVIEAVPERLELKQKLFRDLDEICRPDAILASNTSSLSVTVLGAVTKHPERVIGMHFFNPAPVMKLVEVIVSDDTSESVAAKVTELARRWGKVPILCQDTPGFIVNRVARNFYGEALRIAAEGTASMEAVDRLLVEAAGFRMGPFRLMDLIGIDVNYDVTKAVYEAYHGEPRYRPHPLQARQVMAGRLGQKSGRGFYRYDEAAAESEAKEPAAVQPEAKPFSGRIAVVGNTALVQRLAGRLPNDSQDAALYLDTASSVHHSLALRWRCDEIEAHLRKYRPNCVFVSFAGPQSMLRGLLQSVEHAVTQQTVIFVSLAGPSATEQASWLSTPGRVRGYAWAGDSDRIEWSVPLQATAAESAKASAVALGACQALGLQPELIRDCAGGVVYRVLSMIFNEAIEVVREGTATPEAIDLAMRYGTNYPKGPMAWMDEIGLLPVLSTLDALSHDFGDDRYRPSPLLRQRIQAGWNRRR